MHRQMTTFYARKPEVRRESRTVYRKAHQRAENKAESLSRLAKAKAASELANEALHAVTALAYETLRDGTPVNVDPVTGDLLIVAPWSSKRYQEYGLRRSEADVLRAYLLQLQVMAAKGKTPLPPLFTFDDVSRRWAVNRADYPTFEAAERWLARYQLTPEAWLQWRDHIRKKRQKWRKKR